MRFQKCPDSCGERIKLQEDGAEILVLSFSFCAVCCSLREHPVFSALVSRRERSDDRKYVCGSQATFVEGVRRRWEVAWWMRAGV